MRLVIAEDEHLERKAMKKLIRENIPKIQVIEEAVNGREAIELAKTIQPNIMLMDIKMPGINGLEAIKKISKINPDIKFILVSAHDTFEYAKTAMRFGIKDYILKPSKKAEIKAALTRVKKEILSEAQLKEIHAETENILKENFITKVLQYPIHPSAHKLYKQLYPNAKSGFFLVCLHEENDIKQICLQTITDHIPLNHIVYLSHHSITICVISKEETIKRPLQLNIAKSLSLQLGKDIFIGIGNVQNDLEEFPTSYRQAYSASIQLKNEKKSSYGFIQKYKLSKDKTIKTIVQYIDMGNEDLTLYHFESSLSRFSRYDKERLFIQIQHLLHNKGIAQMKSTIESLKTMIDWIKFLKVCCLKCKEYNQSLQSVEKAKKYILTNYNKQITLEEVASSVNLSPNYFSHLFRKALGETFIEFLTRVRMEKAVDLLAENKYSLKEINFKIGYNDPNYFSRVFKRHYGVSPRNYQQKFFK